MKNYILVLIGLFIGLSFAGSFSDITSCVTSSSGGVYSVLGNTFLYTTQGQTLTCSNTTDFIGFTTSGVWSDSACSGNLRGVFTDANSVYIQATGDMSTDYTYLKLPSSNNYSLNTAGVNGVFYINGFSCGTTNTVNRVWLNKTNSTHFTLYGSGGCANLPVALGSSMEVRVTTTAGGGCGSSYSYVYLSRSADSPYWIAGNTTEFTNTAYRSNGSISTEYYASSFNGKMLRSNFTTGGDVPNPGYMCKAFIYSGSTMLTPKITYFPGIGAYPDFYNQANNVAYLMNNTAAYVLDSTSGVWYNVLPFSCVDNSTIYSQTALLYPFGISGSIPPLPSMYVIQNCYINGNNFTWDIKGTGSKTYYFSKYYNNSSGGSVLDYSSFTGLEYTGTTNTTNLTLLNITDGYYTICGYQNNSVTFFDAPSFLTDFPISSLLGKVTLLMMVGVTVLIPYAAFAVVFFNDLFNLYDQITIFTLAVMGVALSLLINAVNEKSLKNIGFYVAIGLAVFTYFVSTLGTGVVGMPTLSDSAGVQLNDRITSILSAMQIGDIGSFFYNGIGLIVAIIIFVISLPSYIAIGIFTPLNSINPNLASAAGRLLGAVTLGVGMYLIVKAFEVASNRYRSI